MELDRFRPWNASNRVSARLANVALTGVKVVGFGGWKVVPVSVVGVYVSYVRRARAIRKVQRQ